MNRSLGDFLRTVEAHDPGGILRVDRHLAANDFAVSALGHKLEEAGEARILILNNLPAVDGSASAFPLVMNVFHSRSLIAQALGLDPDQWRTDLSMAFAEREQQPGRQVVVPADEAPCREVVLTGDAADVRRLPIPMYHQDDVGPYLVMVNLMRHPNGTYDATFTKNLVLGPHRLSLSSHGHHHLRRIVRHNEADGEPTPVAIAVTHHPAFFLGSVALLPYGHDDYGTIAGFMPERELRLAPSVTWGADFLVPADADLIIEGVVPPGERCWQNPFGEISGHYQERMQVPVIEVTAITHRRGAMVQGILPAHREHWNLGSVPKEGSVLNQLRRNLEGVSAFHLPHSGCGRFSAYVALNKRMQSDPMRAAMTVFSEVYNVKMVVVVDDDVDIFNEREVMWAVATQTRWETDAHLVPQIQAFRSWIGHAGMVIDATRPLDDPNYPKRNEIPRHALESINLDDFLRVQAGARR